MFFPACQLVSFVLFCFVFFVFFSIEIIARVSIVCSLLIIRFNLLLLSEISYFVTARISVT